MDSRPVSADAPFGPLLLVFAHPDDEVFGCAGTMAAAVEAGAHVALICATRGEMGDSSIPNLDEPEMLGAVREEELRAANALIGVTDVRLLDYRDSGMPGSPANAHPRAFANVPEDLVAARLVVAIRALRPTTVVTFGPDGVYGHPDHLVAHRATEAAVGLAADGDFRPELGAAWRVSALYFLAIPRDELLAMFEQRGKPGNGMPPELLDRMGTPREEIDTWIDISPWAEGKRRAMAAHRSQTGEGGPIQEVAEDAMERRLSRETFRRVSLPWTADGGDVVAAIAAAHPYRGPRAAATATATRGGARRAQTVGPALGSKRQ